MKLHLKVSLQTQASVVVIVRWLLNVLVNRTDIVIICMFFSAITQGFSYQFESLAGSAEVLSACISFKNERDP